MLALKSEIEFEPTRHRGLWGEEAVCGVLLSGDLSCALRFSVALEAGAAEGLDADAIRRRLEAELARDLKSGLPDALGVVFGARPLPGGLDSAAQRIRRSRRRKPKRGAPPPFEWRDALRRLGYHNLRPHGAARLGARLPRDGIQRWRRTLR